MYVIKLKRFLIKNKILSKYITMNSTFKPIQDLNEVLTGLLSTLDDNRSDELSETIS